MSSYDSSCPIQRRSELPTEENCPGPDLGAYSYLAVVVTEDGVLPWICSHVSRYPLQAAQPSPQMPVREYLCLQTSNMADSSVKRNKGGEQSWLER